MNSFGSPLDNASGIKRSFAKASQQRREADVDANVEFSTDRIDWRAELCHLARASPEIPDLALLEVLKDIKELWVAARVISCEGARFYYQVIYRTHCCQSKTPSYFSEPTCLLEEQ
jgi:hypothetical protein